ncbi:hypothetical protein K438DRAFT_1757710 [Mycena galopus ATCC 62051]|nr:hypothetical protein K438DRAFT_1757710 [Mycena galopus ATCC 62051]
MNYVVDSAEFEDRWNTLLFTVSVNSASNVRPRRLLSPDPDSAYSPDGTIALRYAGNFLTISLALALTLSTALYVVFFLYSIHTLRRSVPGHKLLVGVAWLMFLLATAGTIIVVSTTAISMRMVYLLVQGYLDSPARLLRLYHSLALGQDIILAVNKSVHPCPYASIPDEDLRSLVTDLLFLYRCYVIWGSRKTILVLPGIMILATVVGGCITGLGYYGLIKLNIPIDPRVPFVMGGITNISMMSLTAGRIWYIRRELRTVTGLRPLRQRYDTAVAIILESGILYCVCVIIYVISISISKSSLFILQYSIIVQGTIFNGVAWGLVQVGVNIVPTLILVRVGMGRSTENTGPSMSNIESQPIFASRGEQPLSVEMQRDGW